MWSELMQLADTLGVPLYLLTYTRLLADRYKVSAAKINDVKKTGITYETDKPGDRVFTAASDLKEWMEDNGYK